MSNLTTHGINRADSVTGATFLRQSLRADSIIHRRLFEQTNGIYYEPPITIYISSRLQKSAVADWPLGILRG